MSLQRSEQNGRNLLPSQTLGSPQRGQGNVRGIKRYPQSEEK